MALPPKLEEFEEDNIVKYGVSVPVAGVRNGGTREIRDIALVMGAMLHIRPKPAAAAEAPATDGPAPA